MRILSKKLTIKAYLLFAAICVALCMFALISSAHAVFLTPLDKEPSEVKVCPEPNCPAMKEHPFRSGTRVVIYETKNGWARVTKLIAREKIAAQFPGQFLPNEVAMWIPVKELPEVAAASPSIQKAIEEEERNKKTRQFSFIPKRPAIPTPRSDRTKVATTKDTETETVPTTEVSKPEAKETEVAALTDTNETKREKDKPEVIKTTTETTEQETPVTAEDQSQTTSQTETTTNSEEVKTEPKAQVTEVAAVESETVEAQTPAGEPAPDAPIPTKAVRAKAEERDVAKEESQTETEVETAKLEEPKPEQETKPVDTEVEAEEKVEEEVETDSFGNPIVSVPKKLTKELRDKRLSKLPSKPNAQLDLKAIIAMRHHGLQLLKSGECSGITEGGRSLSLAGWVYLRCENDPNFRQYSVE